MTVIPKKKQAPKLTKSFGISLPQGSDSVELTNRWLDLCETHTGGNQSEMIRTLLDGAWFHIAEECYKSMTEVVHNSAEVFGDTTIFLTSSNPNTSTDSQKIARENIKYRRHIMVAVTMQKQDETPEDRMRREANSEYMMKKYGEGTISLVFRKLLNGSLYHEMLQETQVGTNTKIIPFTVEGADYHLQLTRREQG